MLTTRFPVSDNCTSVQLGKKLPVTLQQANPSCLFQKPANKGSYVGGQVTTELCLSGQKGSFCRAMDVIVVLLSSACVTETDSGDNCRGDAFR